MPRGKQGAAFGVCDYLSLAITEIAINARDRLIEL